MAKQEQAKNDREKESRILAQCQNSYSFRDRRKNLNQI